jgi:SAM-dependent methyltransferase
MTNTERQAARTCPGCGATRRDAELPLPGQPTILNYRCRSRDDARAITRRDMLLAECARCRLVFNAAFDPSAVPYDEQYENTQCHSEAFAAHLDALADRWTNRFSLGDAGVLEVGCGKGDFLRILCRRAGARGFGYDTSYAGAAVESDPEIHFHARYVTPDSMPAHHVDLIVCRHVVEHVPEIGDFFSLLHALATRAGNVPVVVETPAWEWIVDNEAFWDVFYEHCNYFTQPTLRRIAEQSGFATLDQALVFGDQYQIIELRPDGSGPAAAPTAAAPSPSLARFADDLAASQERLAGRLTAAGAEKGWAIWGAGAKGVALANALVADPPTFVIDANPAKQGGFVPGSAVPIIAPEDARVADVPVVLVANANYLDEIRRTLEARGLCPTLVTV